MDTILEGISLTQNQVYRSDSLKNNLIKGFSFWPDKAVIVSERQLSQTEIDKIKNDLRNLHDTEPDFKIQRRQRKKAIMAKLGLNKHDLKSLLELIQDSDDDT